MRCTAVRALAGHANSRMGANAAMSNVLRIQSVSNRAFVQKKANEVYPKNEKDGMCVMPSRCLDNKVITDDLQSAYLPQANSRLGRPYRANAR